MSEAVVDQVAPQEPAKRLGKLPAKGDARTLNFARFVQLDRVPKKYNPWKTRAPFSPRTFGNTLEGCCTKASQALAAMRFERFETRSTIFVPDSEIHRVYRESVRRHYGTDEDMGMYELDALSDFRKPEYTFKDDKGHPITIDAFTQVNHRDKEEVKAAIALSGKFGIKICLNLPAAFQDLEPPQAWDIPRNADGTKQPLVGRWMPGTWGGHSMFTDSYDEVGVRLVHSWYEGLDRPKDQWPTDEQILTWDAFFAYVDESYWLVDSIDTWRKKKVSARAPVDLKGIIKAVNKVSSTKIET